MKTVKLSILFLILSLGCFTNLIGQSNSEKSQKFEIGIGLLGFNRNWTYYDNLSPSGDEKSYYFSFLPSAMIKFNLKNYSLRLKYEYSKRNSSFESNVRDLNEYIDGKFVNNHFQIGIEKPLINKRIIVSIVGDIGFAVTKFDGLYSKSHGSPPMPDQIIWDSFNLNGWGVTFQPGVVLDYKIFEKIYISLESSIYVQKGFEDNDPEGINLQNKFIPRPISFLGINYSF